MKNTASRSIATLSLLLLGEPAAYSQGSLTPPGAPAPTMKRLDQIEARTIVNAANTPGDATSSFIISAPGSYFLTGNITGTTGKNGIRISASDVTLDLNGFALIGTTDALHGIAVYDAQNNVALRNGSLRGWQFTGVTASSSSNCVFEQLRVSGNGSGGALFGFGINAGPSSIVKDCGAKGNSAGGIVIGAGGLMFGCVAEGNAPTGFLGADRSQASNCNASGNSRLGFDFANCVTIVDCTANGSLEYGIRVAGASNVVRCVANQIGTEEVFGTGILTGDGCTVGDCTAALNHEGIHPGSGTTVKGCTARANSVRGIYSANNDCQLIGNTCSANYAGLVVTGNRNRVDGNSCLGNVNTSLSVSSGTGTLVIRNTYTNNFIFIDAGNSYGPLVDVSAGGPIANAHPWANFKQ